MRIMAIERDVTACNYYRILSPLNALDEQGLAEVYFIKEAQLGEPAAHQLMIQSDVIVFSRPSTKEWFNFIKACRKIGKIVVTDYDDDPFNTSPMNPYYQHVGIEEVVYQWADGTQEKLWSEDMVSAGGKKIFNIERNIHHRDMFRLNFKKADIVTCTTDVLRQEFLKINPNVEVLPNLIDPDFYPQGQEFVKKEIRIGWQGGASHYEDLWMIRPAIVEVLKKHKNAKFVYAGDMRFVGLFKDVPKDQLEMLPWISHSAYPFRLFSMNLDIGLCPVIDNVFNRNKSAIKWMEYSTVGAASIASKIPPYSPVIEDRQTGILAGEDPKEWLEAMDELIMNRSLRQKLAENAKDEVFKNHNIHSKAHLWLDAYDRAIKGELVAA